MEKKESRERKCDMGMSLRSKKESKRAHKKGDETKPKKTLI